MRIFIAYFAAACLIAMGSYMALFVLIPNITEYRKFKDAPLVPVTELSEIQKRYRRLVEVNFTYQYEGESFTSERFQSFQTFTQEDDRFRAIKSRSLSDSALFCYVDPAEPSQAVLVNDFDYFSFWMLLLGFVLFPLSLACYAIYCGRYEARIQNG